MKRRLFILTILVFTTCIHADGKGFLTESPDSSNRAGSKGDTVSKKKSKSLHGHLHYSFIEPASLIDFYNGYSLRLGTEYAINRRYAMNATIGTYFNSSYIFKLELRRYFYYEKHERRYVSLLYSYKHTNLPVNDISDTLPKGSPHYDINYRVDKFVTVGDVHVGIIKGHKHHIIIDEYVGLGVRYRSVRLEDITPYEADHRYHHNEGVVDGYTNDFARAFRVNFSLGIRIGYRW